MVSTKTADKMAEFTVEQARAFYDRFGRKQDWQAFYEDPATQALVDHAAFGGARRVIEFGCGTGRLAERLLRRYLPADATYLGIDVSPTMVGIARERLRPWERRAEVRLSDGSATLQELDACADRFVSTYVFDLLSPHQISEVLKEAHRVLHDEARLCLVSLTHGRGVFGRLICATWQRVHALSPRLVGGCRPIDLTEFIRSDWDVRYLDWVSSFSVTSEVLIASPQKAG